MLQFIPKSKFFIFRFLWKTQDIVNDSSNNFLLYFKSVRGKREFSCYNTKIFFPNQILYFRSVFINILTKNKGNYMGV